jgi:phosphatidylglycerol---prolipoprotein diacylglyceryl transferase
MLPILYQSNDFTLYSYPLLMGIGWGVGHQILSARSQLSHVHTGFLFWGLFIFAWLGAKLLFLISADQYLASSLFDNLSFWTGGGLVFYGGLLGGGIFLALWRLKYPLNLPTVVALIVALTAGHGIGRIGCLLAGCCYGEETNLWWGITLHGHLRHPTQLIESMGLLFLSLYLWRRPANYRTVSYYFLIYGLLRFFVEFLRGDIIRGSWGPLTPSQWISLLMILIGILLHRRKM